MPKYSLKLRRKSDTPKESRWHEWGRSLTTAFISAFVTIYALGWQIHRQEEFQAKQLKEQQEFQERQSREQINFQEEQRVQSRRENALDQRRRLNEEVIILGGKILRLRRLGAFEELLTSYYYAQPDEYSGLEDRAQTNENNATQHIDELFELHPQLVSKLHAMAASYGPPVVSRANILIEAGNVCIDVEAFIDDAVALAKSGKSDFEVRTAIGRMIDNSSDAVEWDDAFKALCRSAELVDFDEVSQGWPSVFTGDGSDIFNISKPLRGPPNVQK